MENSKLVALSLIPINYQYNHIEPPYVIRKLIERQQIAIIVVCSVINTKQIIYQNITYILLPSLTMHFGLLC